VSISVEVLCVCKNIPFPAFASEMTCHCKICQKSRTFTGRLECCWTEKCADSVAATTSFAGPGARILFEEVEKLKRSWEDKT